MQRGAAVRCCTAVVLALLCASAHADGDGAGRGSQPGAVGNGLGAWSSVMAHVLVNREGSVDGAKAALTSFQQETHSQLKSIVDALAAPGASFPDLPIIKDPLAFMSGDPFATKADASSGLSRKGGANFQAQAEAPFQAANVTGASLSSVFFNYAPCLISQDLIGAAATVVGVNFVPQIINIAVRGAQVLPIGVNINPAVILVNPQGAAVWPRGVNVQPTLIAIVPTGLAVAPKGVEVAPYGIAVTGK